MKPSPEASISHSPTGLVRFESHEGQATGRPLVLTLIAVLAAGTLAAGALAAAVWRGVIALDQHEVERQIKLQEFHAGLLDEMRELAEQSGMLNSADLCLVRFRVHFDGHIYEPMFDPSLQSRRQGPRQTDSWVSDGVEAKLWWIDEPELLIDRDRVVNGQLKFGLLPPGAYRLDLTFKDEYELRHQFKVRPGLPVDRLVLCPRPGAHNPPGGRIEVVWPEALADHTLIAICEVERDVSTCGEWVWNPIHPERVTVMAGGQEMLDAIATSSLVLDDVLPNAPFRYCRMTEISVFHVPGDGRTPVAVGSCVFGDDWPADGGALEPSRWDMFPYLDSPEPFACARVVCQRNAPRHEAVYEHWRIELPAELIDAVSRNLKRQND